MSDDLDAFVAAARAFLDAHAELKPTARRAGWGAGSDAVGLLEVHDDREQERADLVRSREWRATVYDAGFGWLGGPVEYGGAGRGAELDDVYRELEAAYDVPSQNIFGSSTHLVGPSLLAVGSEELKREFLPRFFRGDVIACQLLSEPEAGSDLAGLRARAVRDGDDWVVSGQKVWNSYAHLADVGQLLARTDPDVPKHAGLTMFLVDMDAPGVTVRPLRQMTGEAHFNEVFLDEVRIPDARRVGEPGQGWAAVIATLMSERSAVGAGVTNTSVDPVARLREAARVFGRADDPVTRQCIAGLAIDARLLEWLGRRLEAAAAAAGHPSGPEGSLLKLLNSAHHRRTADAVAAILGPRITADSGEWGTFAWTRYLCGAPMLRIAGGTDEIQRNIVAERVLGLPREPAAPSCSAASEAAPS